MPPEDQKNSAPHVLDAERGLLGSLLMAADRLFPFLEFHGFYGAYFYQKNHAALFEVMREMHHLGQLIDPVNVTERLKALKEFEKLGGSAFLSALTDATPSSAFGESYALLMKDAFLRRCVIQAAFELQTEAHSAEKTGLQVVEQSVQRLSKVISGEVRDVRTVDEIAYGLIGSWRDIHHRKRKMVGLSTGIDGLDFYLGGLRAPQMYCVAARPSVGKTSLALTIARGLCDVVEDPESTETDPELRFKKIYGKHTAIVSMDSDRDELVERNLCCAAGVSGWKLNNGFADNDDFDKLDAAVPVVGALPIHVMDHSRDWYAIASWLRGLKAKGMLNLVVIDYLQQIQVDGKKFFGDTERVTWVSGAIKALLRELGVPGIVIVQLNRDLEKADNTRPPRASDMRDSGAIEQDANMILMLWADPEWTPLDEKEARQRVAVRGELVKQKGGPKGVIPFYFYQAYYRFETPPRLKVHPQTAMPLFEHKGSDRVIIDSWWVRYNRPPPESEKERDQRTEGGTQRKTRDSGRR